MLIYYEFPGTNITSVSQPYIVEDTNNSGWYYICGSYADANESSIMYVMYVDGSSGSVSGTGWSYRYTSGFSLEPRGIIVSPYNNDELIIIGKNEPDPNQVGGQQRASDGFVMNLDATNGSVNWFNIYGDNNADEPLDNEFMSINIALSTSGGTAGYIIGGKSTVGTVDYSWLLKLDPNGGVVWSTLISNSASVTDNGITGVVERYSNVYGAFEYYCSSPSIAGAIVYRVDDTGTLFTGGVTPPLNNEYIYTSAVDGPVFISYIETNGSAWYQDGIEVYSTKANDIYDVKACFSGQSNCNEGFGIATQIAGPTNIINMTPTQFSGLILDPCSGADDDIVIEVQHRDAGNDQTINSFAQACFSSSIPAGGNNNRMLGVTEQSAKNSEIKVFPNPAHNEITISYASLSEKNVSIDLYDYTGRLMKSFDNQTTQNSHEVKLDLSNLKLSSGIYFIKTNANNKTHVQKIVIE